MVPFVGPISPSCHFWRVSGAHVWVEWLGQEVLGKYISRQ